MDLQETWKKLERESLNKPVAGAVLIQKRSKHPVQKLIQGFAMALVFIIIFEVGFGYLAFIMPQLIIKIVMIIMVLIYLIFFIFNYRVWIKLKTRFNMDGDLKTNLQQIHHIASTALSFQRKTAIYIYPIAAASGFLLGLSESADVLEMLQKKVVLISLPVTSLLLTPISYYFALWLEKISYGKYLQQLQTLIDNFNNTKL